MQRGDTSVTPRPGQRAGRPYHHGALRERLVAEALELVRESGLARLSLREVARRVGVSHAAAYHHFPGKEDILAAAAAVANGRLADALEAVEAEAYAEPDERLCRLGEEYVGFALRHPAIFRLALAPEVAHKGRFPELRAAADRAASPLLRSLRRRPGADAAGEEGIRELAVALWSLVHGMAMLALDRQLDEGELRVDAPGAEAAMRALARRAVKRHLAGGG